MLGGSDRSLTVAAQGLSAQGHSGLTALLVTILGPRAAECLGAVTAPSRSRLKGSRLKGWRLDGSLGDNLGARGGGTLGGSDRSLTVAAQGLSAQGLAA
jgi:hypothetical protein